MNQNEKKKRHISAAMSFILLMGLVSLFSDMTHEGASSIIGGYLSLSGASAETIGFISGFGIFVGYAFRLISGYFTDKTKKYWTFTIVGYIIDICCIPLLALVPENGWMWACMILIVEKIGKAMKKPAKDTIVSFAAKQEGVGKSFAIHEFVDQLGAFLGPMFLYLILLFTTEENEFKKYAICFAFLAIPAIICIGVLLFAKMKFPTPENFEVDDKKESNKVNKLSFILYLCAIAFYAFGFIDFALITMHESNNSIAIENLPLLYAGAMLVDAFAALFFGFLYDKKGFLALIISTILSSCFSLFIFKINTTWALITGLIMWGIGMGAQESILKAAIATITTKENRSKAFGIFETIFGLSWFLGSWLMGKLYDNSIDAMIVVSITAQMISVILYLITYYVHKKEKNDLITTRI